MAHRVERVVFMRCVIVRCLEQIVRCLEHLQADTKRVLHTSLDVMDNMANIL